MKIKNICADIMIYFLVIIVVFGYLTRGRSAYGGQMCMSDVLCRIEHYGKNFLQPFFMFITVKFFREDFRTSVLLRYKKMGYVVRDLIKKAVLLSISLGTLQTLAACLYAGAAAPFPSNWNRYGSYMSHNFGIIMEPPVPTAWLIFLYFYVTVVQMAIVCFILCFLWWLTETPVSGYILLLVLLAYESASPNKILFHMIDMAEENIVYKTIGVGELFLYPLVLMVVLAGSMILVLRKKDFMRLS